jgi:hypothetical protein
MSSVNTLIGRLTLPVFFVFTSITTQATTEAKAVFTSVAPRIDGRLDDASWKQATKISDLVQRLPNTGELVSETTEVYILYDKNYIYIGMHCADDPKKITANELARDISLGNDDRVQVIFDTFLDGRNGYWFQIGPKGSIGDALVSENGAGFNKEWDGLFDGKASINETGWDAELAIPFKTLNFKPGQAEWGMKILRHIKRKSESAYWPVANRDTYMFQISDSGLLTGLEGITKGIGLDIRPYAITGIDNPETTDNNYIRNKNPLFNIGGDIFYRLTPGIKTALTFNTDFAQTEVDSRQINLTRFNLLFPEKRNFFLDGAQYFNFGISGQQDNRYGKRNIPFFSRSIGLDQNGNPIPMVWGAKVTGQAGNYNIGFQHMVDKPDDNRSFTVARLTRNIGNQSYVGFLVTDGNALDSTDNQLVGLDARIGTAKFKGNKILALSGFGLKSFTEGLEGKDFSWGTELNYPNDFLKFRLGHQEIGENYRAGAGFVPRFGIRENYIETALGPRPNKYGILQINFRAGADFITDFHGRLLTRDYNFTPLEVNFISGDIVKFSSEASYDLLDEDFEIFPTDSISISAGTYDFWRYTVDFSSAQRRKIWIHPAYTWGSFYDGNRRDFIISFGYKINTPIFIGMDYVHNDVSLPDGDFETRIYRVNANFFFGPDISLTNYVQYDNVSRKIGWQTRFRWILKPGNEILFAWNSSIFEEPEKDRFEVQQSTTRLKLNYNIRF